jgi:hypothetical protein
MNDPVIEALTQRVDRLERKSRHLKWWAIAATVVLIAIVVVDVPVVAFGVVWFKGIGEHRPLTALSSISFRDEARRDRLFVGVEKGSRPPSMVFRDQEGRARLSMGLDPDGGVGLSLIDRNGKTRGLFELDAKGDVGLHLMDSSANLRCGVGLLADGTIVQSFRDAKGLRIGVDLSEEGNTGIAIFDPDGKLRLRLGVAAARPTVLEVLGPDGKPQFTLPQP